MAKAQLKPKKEKTDKALLITSIVLTVIMLVGLVFSLILWQAVEDLLHPETTQTENGEENNDAADQAGRAIAAVVVGILLIPIWIGVELLTVIFAISPLVTSSTLCGRLARDRKLAKRYDREMAEQTDSATPEESDSKMAEQYDGKVFAQPETIEPESIHAPKRNKGMLIASIVLIVVNVAALAVLVGTTLMVIL